MFRFARGSASWLMAPLVVVMAIAVLAGYTGSQWIALLAIVPFGFFFFFMAFFRDPDRPIAEGIASPADGKVVFVDEVVDADLGPMQRFSIFMHPKDVHVNRFPLDGTVVTVRHVPGKHIPAFNKESDRNERVETIMALPDGTRIKVIQIAGAVARRIVPYIKDGHVARRGERMGLIRLGSRCDLLVPKGRAHWVARPGDQVYAGATGLGEWLPAAGASGASGAPNPPAGPGATAATPTAASGAGAGARA